MPAGPVFSRCVLVVLCMLWLPAAAEAHALLHERVDGDALTLRLSFPGSDQPLFEPYEIFAPGVETPFQSGRVNALGELSFRPDRPGAWRIRVFTEDGHGAVIALDIDDAGTVAAAHADHHHAGSYGLRVLAALGYLLGLFGLAVLWRQRRDRASPG